MYIFHPMFARPMGMMKTNTSLGPVSGSSQFTRVTRAHARTFSISCEKATPFARIE